ncbi:MAG TPA: DUF3131 domain-containing protein [Gemmatimonadaceae bacterium]|nr:DUF3131 domain-containing protein [Gemmatimonadaceae bacterium]
MNTRLCLAMLAVLALSATNVESQSRTKKKPKPKPTPTRPAPVPGPTALTTPDGATVVDERQLFSNAARIAWAFVDRNYQPATGLARAHDTYQYVTLWDIASGLAATYSAHELGLVSDPIYNLRMQRALNTLSQADLFENAAFNRSYDSKTGRMIDRKQSLSSRGFGWSVTDLGRLLTWLKIISVNQPQFATQAANIVKRLDMSRLIKNGYLQSEDLSPSTGALHPFQEGRIGYEQYAAAGFALWGYRAENALDASLNALPVSVLGVSIVADKRGDERLTGEPYIMMGMETGWYSPELRQQAWRILAAQEARYKSTGILTMVSEDALPDPPYYFYYYDVYRQGRSFVVDGPTGGPFVESPRWISSKAAFAWHALLPSPYTLAVLQAVQSAGLPGRGWGAGVYEGTLQPTGDASLNTAALILEAALYNLRGRPFLVAPGLTR